MITYTNSLEGINEQVLSGGFFAGWPNPPSPAAHLKMLEKSYERVLAKNENNMVIGYVTAISDSVSCAYIPHLEVLQEYQHQGIGSELVKRILAKFTYLYMIDLLCDENLQSFYQQLGMHNATGMMIRNYPHQSFT